MHSILVAFCLFIALASSAAYGQNGSRSAKPSKQPATDATVVPKPAAQSELYQQVARLDAEMFAAFNAHDADKLMAYFAPGVEFYHDKGGLSNFTQTKEGFARLFAQTPNISRTLVPGSLEVYPVKDYGAMHIGVHRFCHVENGRDDCGNSKFVMVWQQQNGAWKITRVVSYDH